MYYKDTFLNRELIEQMEIAQKIAGKIDTPAMRDALYAVNHITEPIKLITDQLPEFPISVSERLDEFLSEPILRQFTENMHFINEIHKYEDLIDTGQRISGALSNYNLINCYSDDLSDEEDAENEEINSKIITEIFRSEEESIEDIHKKDSAIITVSPVNEAVLKYLSENPQVLYQLTSRQFEEVMAEIYNKLGYKVELTKATRDGGKDIILRKPEILGDFIYYVECKQNAPKRHVGVGIIRNLIGTINTDRVNGGILVTTSYFTPDAKKFIIDNKYDYQIQMHDYDMIRKLLDQIT